MSKVINIESVKQTVLYKTLIQRNNEDFRDFTANISVLCEEAADRATQIPTFFSQYTLHDKTHFIRVTELMAKVLGPTLDGLNDIEIGLLILAAFYHDQGMVLDGTEYASLHTQEAFILFRDNWLLDHANYREIKNQQKQSTLSETEKQRLSAIEIEMNSAILTDFLRETHGQRSHDYILSKFQDDKRLFVMGTNITHDLANICLSHSKPIDWLSPLNGLNYDENIGTYKVNTIFLSVILRLADILDFDSDRTPAILFKSIHFTNSLSVMEWQKHRSVKGWEISKDAIRFTMDFDHPVYEKSARTFMNWIDQELADSHARVKQSFQAGAQYYLQIAERTDKSRLRAKKNAYLYHDLEFTLSRDELVKLLMTDKLYQNPSLFIRELLQNSLDALRLRRALYQKDGFNWDAGSISFKHYLDSNGQQVVECIDNGCGMDEEIVTKFLGKVGRSYYRSPEFDRQRAYLKEKGADFEPCSQFGIGFMSCFMIGDKIDILTRRDNGPGKEQGRPLHIEINGVGGLIVIREGRSSQLPGTTVKVYPNKRPAIFDTWSDNIKLVTTLKGYAMATEFPITALCEIEEIQGRVDIPISVDKKYTFLEKLKVRQQKTLEIDLSTIHKNLTGFLRQSFLVNDNGVLCTENNEARWNVLINNNENRTNKEFKIVLCLKGKKEQQEYSYFSQMDEGTTICMDGILVCGHPGRSEYSKYETAQLGYRTSLVGSEHPSTVDIRGLIKPMLTPSREPVNRNAFDLSEDWRYIQHLINLGCGQLWANVISSTNLPPEDLWKIILLYDGSISHINSNILIKNISLPVENKQWIKLEQIKSFLFRNNSLTIYTNNNQSHVVEFPTDIIIIGKAHRNETDVLYLVYSTMQLLSKVKTQNDHAFTLRNTFSSKESPADHLILKSMKSFKCIPFEDLPNEYIASSAHKGIANINNSLVKLVLESRFISTKNEIQEFAESLVFTIRNLIDDAIDEEKKLTIKKNSRQLKYASILFNNLDWTKYDNNLRPPYRIFVSKSEIIEITDADFKIWANQKIS